MSEPGAAGGTRTPPRVVVCGHRGVGRGMHEGGLAENTLPSIERAMAEGADMVEIDVQLSADGVPVVIHDTTVDRTTDGTGCVGALQSRDLAALDAGGGARIPTLEEAARRCTVALNVELKRPRDTDDTGCPRPEADVLARAAVKALRGRSAVRISSFDLEVLRAVRSEAPDPSHVSLGYLIADEDELAAAIREAFDAVHLDERITTPERIRAIHAAGQEAYVWTVDDPDAMRRLARWGVDGIITDEPGLLRDLLR